ncbi:MAG TPA: aspartate--tRNA(Asn) ligase [Candidatus Eremiobacteraceae bacterium]|nr:aspartate--tRNA(Asn) ligase [Candidatus Eremiobacteraceae bacterium]
MAPPLAWLQQEFSFEEVFAGMGNAKQRVLIETVPNFVQQEVTLRGWVSRIRVLGKTIFVLLKDCSGEVQCVAAPESIKEHHLKLEDTVEIVGRVRQESRAKLGYEVDIDRVYVLSRSGQHLPFTSYANLDTVNPETLVEYRALSLRNPIIGNVFRIQAALLRFFREFLTQRRFTEIITSKLVSSGTEGGTNLFEVKYFDRVAYLAQSPQFYKEHGVGGFERVFETGHVYRAEPHATSRHLTEYYSLDLEFGFIDGPEDVIQLERELLTYMFENTNRHFGDLLGQYRRQALPSMLDVPCWGFAPCLELLKENFGREDLSDDLDPEAERQLCQLAEKECGVPAVFVLGFPLSGRPFYTAPRGTGGAANSFDLLYQGIEITTGGQRLHRREELENALRARGIDPNNFESHLKMFDLGMPPHGGFAIGLERLTAQVLNLSNVRQATLYPRDRTKLNP